MNLLIPAKSLRKLSQKQRNFWYVIQVWIIGGALGLAFIFIPLSIKHPEAIALLFRALTP
jgi:hypothetical protein